MTRLECSTLLRRTGQIRITEIDAPNWLLTEFKLLTELELLTELKLEAEFVSHPDSLARRPIDPAMGNSFGSYSEPGTRNSYEAETSPMVRDDDDVTPELRRRQGEGVRQRKVLKRFRR